MCLIMLAFLLGLAWVDPSSWVIECSLLSLLSGALCRYLIVL